MCIQVNFIKMYRQTWHNDGMRTKQASSTHITPGAKRLLTLRAEKLGLSRSAILELVIWEKAKREGVK